MAAGPATPMNTSKRWPPIQSQVNSDYRADAISVAAALKDQLRVAICRHRFLTPLKCRGGELPPLRCMRMQECCEVYSDLSGCDNVLSTCQIRIYWLFTRPVRSLGKTLLAFTLLHSVLQGQICLLFQVALDFLPTFALQSSIMKRTSFLGVSSKVL